MKRINKNNYEAFFLDYLEGNLSGDLQAEFMQFLAENPDLKFELDAFEFVELPKENVSYQGKSLLKKKASPYDAIQADFDNYCIAQLEGDLSEAESKLFNEFLDENPEKRKDFEQYKAAVLIPENITYKNKQSLKRMAVIGIAGGVRRLYPILSLAASLILLLTLTFLIDLPKNQTDTQTAYDVVDTMIPVMPFENLFWENNAVKQKANPNKTETTKVNQKKISSKNKIAQNEIGINTIEKPEINSIAPKSIHQIAIAAKLPKNLNYTVTEPEIVAEVSTEDQQTLSALLKIALQNKLKDESEETPGFWEFAEAGVNDFSRLTGKSIFLESEYDDSGKLKALALSTPRFKLSKNPKR